MASALNCADLEWLTNIPHLGGERGGGGRGLLVESPTLKVYRREKEQASSVVWFSAPQFHTELFRMIIVASLVLCVSQLG